MKKQKWTMGLVAIAAVSGYVINGSAQSVDSLLDKLVDKGVLSVKEANELREESDKDFTKAYSAKSGMPEWVSALKFNGDFRGRYDMIDYRDKATIDRQRLRSRIRFGMTASMADSVELGFRLMSDEPSNGASGGDPTSGNSTFTDNASKKPIYIDQAFGKWIAFKSADQMVSAVFGKMENPYSFSDILFDADYTPEGLALNYTYKLSPNHNFKAVGGIFIVDENSLKLEDPFFSGVQMRVDSTWSKHWSSSVSVGWFGLHNEDGLANTITNGSTVVNNPVPNQNRGNTRIGVLPGSPIGDLGGALAYDYQPIVAEASITFTADSFWHYDAPFPVRFGADYINNPEGGPRNQGWSAGVSLGKAGRRGLWEIIYRYRYLEADAWFEEFADSNWGGRYQTSALLERSGYAAGTNVKGHMLRLGYSPFDSMTLSLSGYFVELITPVPSDSESQTARIHADATIKF